MPNYTLAEMMSQVTTRAGRRADIPKSDVSFWINASYQEVADSEQHALQECIVVSSTTSGTRRIELPGDFGEIINVSNLSKSNSALTLPRVSASRIDAEEDIPVVSEPRRYILYNNFIELDPTPDSAYSIQLRYRSMATDLVDESAVPSLSTPWRKAILYLAEAEIWAFVNDPANESIARSRYFNYVRQLKNDEARRQTAESGMGVQHTYREPRAISARSFDQV